MKIQIKEGKVSTAEGDLEKGVHTVSDSLGNKLIDFKLAVAVASDQARPRARNSVKAASESQRGELIEDDASGVS